MEYIRIKLWETYQHYKDRSAPWIKLHREILSSHFWVMGSDASKLLAICIMLLAQRTDNKIPADLEYIKRFGNLTESPDLTQLLASEFIEIIDENGCYQPASNVLAKCTPEENRIEERRKTSSSAEKSADKQKWSDEDLKAAQYIHERILKISPSAKEPPWHSWAGTIRLMRERDGRTHREICELFAWANADSFWSANILSPKTLREKWTQLDAKRRQGTGSPKKLDWWSTDNGILSKGLELGMEPRVGESWQAFRKRINERLEVGNELSRA